MLEYVVGKMVSILLRIQCVNINGSPIQYNTSNIDRELVNQRLISMPIFGAQTDIIWVECDGNHNAFVSSLINTLIKRIFIKQIFLY